MGAGDWVMATSQVKALNIRTFLPVLVIGLDGRAQWNEVFDNNHRIIRSPIGQRFVKLVNAPGARPYILSKDSRKFVWKRWHIAPGEIFLSDVEKTFGLSHAGHVLIEPNVKVAGSNKEWFFERWQALVNACPDVKFVQLIGSHRGRVLRGVKLVRTPSFRHAMAILSLSRAFVGTEGGLHHAAAAFKVPAVVLFSEYVTPDITGYPEHRNICHADTPCGMRIPCATCRLSMESITVEEVRRNLREIIA